MDLSTAEIDVLKVLAHLEGERSTGVSVERLYASLNDDATSAVLPSSDVIRTLRRLHEKHFVTFDTGDTITITDTGLAALKAM